MGLSSPRRTFGGAQIVKPETVASMYQNHIGDLQVVEMKTAQPRQPQDGDHHPETREPERNGRIVRELPARCIQLAGVRAKFPKGL
jgi:hypothetical protein